MDPGAGQPPALGTQQEHTGAAGSPWGGAQQAAGSSGTYGNMMDMFLDDACPSALFTDLLDPATLAAMAGSSGVDPVPPPAPGVAEDARKKLAEQQDSDNSDAEEGGGGSKGGGGKRSRSEANQAAKNKATREKARREKINDRWVLQTLCRGREGGDRCMGPWAHARHTHRHTHRHAWPLLSLLLLPSPCCPRPAREVEDIMPVLAWCSAQRPVLGLHSPRQQFSRPTHTCTCLWRSALALAALC